MLSWDDAKKWGVYPANAAVNKGDVIFPRIDLKKEMQELENLTKSPGPGKDGAIEPGEDNKQAAAGTKPGDGKRPSGKPDTASGKCIPETTPAVCGKASGADDSGMITIDDFAKIDLRVAKVLEAEKVEGSEKLVKLSVEIGSERGRLRRHSKVLSAGKPGWQIGDIVANLKPARLKGIESQA